MYPSKEFLKEYNEISNFYNKSSNNIDNSYPSHFKNQNNRYFFVNNYPYKFVNINEKFHSRTFLQINYEISKINKENTKNSISEIIEKISNEIIDILNNSNTEKEFFENISLKFNKSIVEFTENKNFIFDKKKICENIELYLKDENLVEKEYLNIIKYFEDIINKSKNTKIYNNYCNPNYYNNIYSKEFLRRRNLVYESENFEDVITLNKYNTIVENISSKTDNNYILNKIFKDLVMIESDTWEIIIYIYYHLYFNFISILCFGKFKNICYINSFYYALLNLPETIKKRYPFLDTFFYVKENNKLKENFKKYAIEILNTKYYKLKPNYSFSFYSNYDFKINTLPKKIDNNITIIDYIKNYYDDLVSSIDENHKCVIIHSFKISSNNNKKIYFNKILIKFNKDEKLILKLKNLILTEEFREINLKNKKINFFCCCGGEEYYKFKTNKSKNKMWLSLNKTILDDMKIKNLYKQSIKILLDFFGEKKFNVLIPNLNGYLNFNKIPNIKIIINSPDINYYEKTNYISIKIIFIIFYYLILHE